jgi:hypothetical protein
LQTAIAAKNAADESFTAAKKRPRNCSVNTHLCHGRFCEGRICRQVRAAIGRTIRTEGRCKAERKEHSAGRACGAKPDGGGGQPHVPLGTVTTARAGRKRSCRYRNCHLPRGRQIRSAVAAFSLGSPDDGSCSVIVFSTGAPGSKRQNSSASRYSAGRHSCLRGPNKTNAPPTSAAPGPRAGVTRRSVCSSCALPGPELRMRCCHSTLRSWLPQHVASTAAFDHAAAASESESEPNGRRPFAFDTPWCRYREIGELLARAESCNQSLKKDGTDFLLQAWKSY